MAWLTGTYLDRLFKGLFSDKTEYIDASRISLQDAIAAAFSTEKEHKNKAFKLRNLIFSADQINVKKDENRISALDATELAKGFRTNKEYAVNGVSLHVYDHKGRIKTRLNADDRYNLALLYEATKAEGLKIANYNDIAKLLEKGGEWAHAKNDWALFDEESLDDGVKQSLKDLSELAVETPEPQNEKSKSAEFKDQADNKETSGPKASYSTDTLNLIIGQLAAETGVISKARVEEVAQAQADMIAVSLALQENGLVSRGEDGKMQCDIEALKAHKLLNKFGDGPDVFCLAFMPLEARAALKDALGVTERQQKVADGYQLSSNGNFNKELGLIAEVPGMAVLLKAANPTKKLLADSGVEFDEFKDDIYGDLTAVQNWYRAGNTISAIAQGKVTEHSATKAEQVVTGNVTKFLAGDLKQPKDKQHDKLIATQSIWVGASLHEMRVYEGLDHFTPDFIAKLPEDTRAHLSKIFFDKDEPLSHAELAERLNKDITIEKIQSFVTDVHKSFGTLFQAERYQALPDFNHEAFSATIHKAGEEFESAFAAASHNAENAAKTDAPKTNAPKSDKSGTSKSGTSASFDAAATKPEDDGRYSTEKLAEYYYLMGKTDNHNDWRIRQLLMNVKPNAEFEMYKQLEESGIYADQEKRTNLEILEIIPGREEFVAAVKRAEERFKPYFDKVENANEHSPDVT